MAYKLRVFVERLSSVSNLCNIVISGSEQRQIRANRLKNGDIVELFDRTGTFLAGKIDKVTPFTTHVTIQHRTQATTSAVTHQPYTLDISLAVGFPKGDRSDILIEKVTEIGVTHILPLITKRTIGNINTDSKYARWNRIVLQASKQSMCPQILSLDQPLNFPNLLGQSFKAEDKKPRKILAVIGPEGDFTTQEKGAMCDAGAIPVVLSVNRLRTETAAIVFVANLISTLSE